FSAIVECWQTVGAGPVPVLPMGNHRGLPLRILFRLIELERRRVDAVTQMGRRRSVGKYMPQMSIAFTAHSFGPAHEKAVVLFGIDVFFGYWRPETWPTGAGVKLGVGAE